MEDKRCINPVEKIQKTCKLKDHEIEEKKLKTKDKLNNINLVHEMPLYNNGLYMYSLI